MLILIAEAEAQTKHSGEHPVVGVVHLRIEAVGEAVGINLERQADRLRDVGLKTQTGTDVVRHAVLVPSQLGVQGLGSFDGLEFIVVPRVVQSESTYEDDVQRMLRRLREEVGEVDEQVGIGGDIVPLVVLIELVEAALGLPGVGMQAESHGREEVVTERQSYGRGEQLVDGGIGGGELQTSLCLNKRPRFQLALALLCIGCGE